MTRDEALEFLRQHQPMPADKELSDDLIDRYDQVRVYLEAHPDPECVPLLLNSFGDGDGFGVYQLVEDVLRSFPPATVLPHLKAALDSTHDSVRSWCAQIAMLYPQEELAETLCGLLEDRNPSVRTWAASALEFNTAASVDSILEGALRAESDSGVRSAIRDILNARRARLV